MGNLADERMSERTKECMDGCVDGWMNKWMSEWIDLEDQINHKIAYVTNRLKNDEHLHILLIGHSVGAYISLEVLHRISNENNNKVDGDHISQRIDGVWGLFPTIQVSWNM